MHWEGLYINASERHEVRDLKVLHAGPMRLTIHSDCAAGGSEEGPLQVFVVDSADRLIVGHALTYYSPRDIERTEVVQPGDYRLDVRIRRLGAFNVPASCGYRIDFSYPR